MSQQITVRYNSSPTRKFTLKDDYGTVIDVTGYTFKLIVKQSADLPDSRAWFDKTGAIITAASGTYKFDLTPAETCLPIGRWPGEIRWWSGATTNPPTDAVSVDFIVEEAMDLP